MWPVTKEKVILGWSVPDPLAEIGDGSQTKFPRLQ
jgi:hypothetical protein